MLVTRTTRRHATAAVLAGTIAAGALGSGALAVSSSLANTSPTHHTGRFKTYLAVLVTTRTVVPRIQRTVRFTGYATYVFHAPKGRRIVSASARITGAEAHAVKIRGRTIARNHTRYTVNLVFPGEQGNPGRLVVRLGTVA
jgi:hypothetical protein